MSDIAKKVAYEISKESNHGKPWYGPTKADCRVMSYREVENAMKSGLKREIVKGVRYE